MTYPAGETVTHLDGTVTGRNELGNDTYTYPVKGVYNSCPVWPSDGNATSANERDYGQLLVTTGLGVGVPDGVVVNPADRFVVRGETWEVAGRPQAYNHPFTGWRPGTVVALTVVTG